VFEGMADYNRANIHAFRNSSRDAHFFVALRGQVVTVVPRRAAPEQSLTGVLTTVVYAGGGTDSAVVGIVIEEAPGPDGEADVHYLPVEALWRMSFRVTRR